MSTGVYSIPSSTSSHTYCTQCPQLERQLKESQSEACQLTAKLEKLQCSMDHRNREAEHSENEHRAVPFQVVCLKYTPLLLSVWYN